MKNIYIISALTLSTLLSCSHYQSYNEGMNRFIPKTLSSNSVPEIKTKGFAFRKTQTGRFPASISEDIAPGKKSTESTEFEASPSNKKLYFLTLFGQYENLKRFSSEFHAPKVEICPHFHTSILEIKEKSILKTKESPLVSKSYKLDYSRLKDEAYLAGRPELSLPVVKDEIYPKVVDILRSEGTSLNTAKVADTFNKALDIHLAKTYSELRELCEYGVSDNYYIYENLITHIKSTQFNAKSENLDTLLKTTVFSNMALVTSLDKNTVFQKSRAISSVKKDPANTYSTELISRLNINWATEYLEYISQK